MIKNKNQDVKSTMKHIALAAFLGIWGACGGDGETASEQDQKDAEAMAGLPLPQHLSDPVHWQSPRLRHRLPKYPRMQPMRCVS